MISVGLRVAGTDRHRGSSPVFLFYKTIKVDYLKVPSDQTDFPVLVSGTYPYLKTVANGGDVQNANGYDIVFSTDTAGVSRLAFEIESYNATTGAINFWVKVPTLSSSADTTFYMVYDCAAISTSQENVPGTWSNGFVTVQHLNGNSNDSTGNGINGTDTAITYGAEWIADGAAFNGTSSQIDLGTNALTDTGSARTASVWVNGVAWSNTYTTLEEKAFSGVGDVTILVKSSGKLAVYLDTITGPPTSGDQHINYDGSGINTLSTSLWYLLSYTYDGSGNTTIVGYVNGALDGTATGTGPSSLAGLGSAGAHELLGASSVPSRYLDGALDEFHLSSVVRSADWLLTEYNNQVAPGFFYTIT